MQNSGMVEERPRFLIWVIWYYDLFSFLDLKPNIEYEY